MCRDHCYVSLFSFLISSPRTVPTSVSNHRLTYAPELPRGGRGHISLAMWIIIYYPCLIASLRGYMNRHSNGAFIHRRFQCSYGE